MTNTMDAPAASTPELAARLRLAVARLGRKLRREAGAGLSPSLLSALSTIERGGPLTLGTLSDSEQVKPPTMTRIVGGLLELGLVTREPDPLDRRVAWVIVTTEGRRLLRRSRRRGNEYLARRLRSLDPEERDILDRATEILERLTGEAP